MYARTATSTRAPTRAGTARAAPTSRRENEIDEGNRCPIHHIELTREQEDNWFFRLSAFQERLEELYRRAPGLRAARARATTRRSSFIALRPAATCSLSRRKLTWGVPVPWDTEHVFYVWFDALLNYYTRALLRAAPAGEDLTDTLLAGRATT